MTKGVTATIAGIGLLWVTSGAIKVAGRQQPLTPVPSASTEAERAVMQKYCVSCHNEKLKTGGLALDTLDMTKVSESAEVWEKVIRKLRAGLMPPPGRPRPDDATHDTFVTWLETNIDRAAAAHPNPGRKDTLHRLNRTEYHNAVRDLLAVDIDVTDQLPIDDASYGFDNIAGTLTLNESLMERYLSVSKQVSGVALGLPTAGLAFKEFRVPYNYAQGQQVDGLPMGTRGGMLVHYVFPRDGEYLLEAKLGCGPPSGTDGVCDGAAGFVDTHQLELTVDGARVSLIKLEPRKFGQVVDGKDSKGNAADAGYMVRVPVTAGPHDVGATFIRLSPVDEFDYTRVRFERPYYQSINITFLWQTIYEPVLSSLTIGGPYNPQGPGDTPSRQRIFVCHPAKAADEAPCATKILTRLATHAYRRAATSAEVEVLAKFYNDARAEGGDFDAGIGLALQRLLVSPKFLFRVERDPAHVAASADYQISDTELASRLSFFLWSSTPDDQLLDLAIKGKLRAPGVLDGQVQRMLADPRAGEMVANFIGQWLQLRKVEVAEPNTQMFPNFDDRLRSDMVKETDLFVDSIRTENRSLVDILTANYSFLNERLAQHYGIQGVKGGYFRRVTYADDNPRRGLLGQGSILTLTSSPIRTRPVVRGKWILSNILGTEPPDPPANVPPLVETGNVLSMTMRERMAAHRGNPVCASCHAMIDPLGFALESFSPVGQYRTVDENFKPIDASGAFPDGRKFSGFEQFSAALANRPETFINTMTERILTYGLGRGVEYYDMPTVRKIVQEARGDNYRFSSWISAVVRSAPFQFRRALPDSVVSPAVGH